MDKCHRYFLLTFTIFFSVFYCWNSLFSARIIILYWPAVENITCTTAFCYAGDTYTSTHYTAAQAQLTGSLIFGRAKEKIHAYHLGIAHYYYYCYFTIIVIIILLLLLLLLLWMQWLLSHAVTHRRHYRLLLSRSVLTRLPFNKPRALKLDWL